MFSLIQSYIPIIYPDLIDNKNLYKEVSNTFLENKPNQNLQCNYLVKKGINIYSKTTDKTLAYHHILPQKLIKRYILNFIKIFFFVLSKKEQIKLINGMNQYLLKKCHPYTKEYQTLRVLFNDKKDKQESSVESMALFFKLLLWNEKNIVVGPIPKEREEDPGSDIDEDILRGCPEDIKNEYRMIHSFLCEKEKEENLINNVINNQNNFKINKDDKSLIGKKYLQLISELSKTKGQNFKDQLIQFRKKFTEDLTSSYSESGLFNIIKKLEAIPLSKCEIKWSKSGIKTTFTRLKNSGQNLKGYKKSNSVSGTFGRDITPTNGLRVNEYTRFRKFD